jgi:hypothetical protein
MDIQNIIKLSINVISLHFITKGEVCIDFHEKIVPLWRCFCGTSILIMLLSRHASFAGEVTWARVVRGLNIVQDVPFKTQPNNSHLLRYKNEIRSRPTPCNRLSQPPP